jgi:hypothetical protein
MPNNPIQFSESQKNRWTGPLQFLMAFLALGLAACASTNLTDSWADPTLQAMPRFKKVMAAALNADPALRRSAEDALVASLKRTAAVPSYAIVPDWEGGSLDRIRDRLQKAGIDGVVTMRLASVEKEQTWVPGTYSSFGGYWGYAYPMVYDPGYLRTDTIVRVETMVYSVADDKLLYAARSRTFNPSSAAETVKEIVASVAEDLKKRGLLH